MNVQNFRYMYDYGFQAAEFDNEPTLIILLKSS